MTKGEQERHRREGSHKYGSCCFFAVLENGSTVTVTADSMKIEGGALAFIGGFRAFEDERAPYDEPIVLAAFGAGQWQYAFASSCMTGEPIAVEHWSEPSQKTAARTAGVKR